jgi:hypothetical protein
VALKRKLSRRIEEEKGERRWRRKRRRRRGGERDDWGVSQRQYVAVNGPALILFDPGDVLFLAAKLVLLSVLPFLVAFGCATSWLSIYLVLCRDDIKSTPSSGSVAKVTRRSRSNIVARTCHCDLSLSTILLKIILHVGTFTENNCTRFFRVPATSKCLSLGAFDQFETTQGRLAWPLHQG